MTALLLALAAWVGLLLVGRLRRGMRERRETDDWEIWMKGRKP